MSEETNRVEQFESIAEKPAMFLTVGEEQFRFIKEEDENWLTEKIKEIVDFMSVNDGKGKSSEEKDTLYKEAQEMWSELGGPDGRLNGIKYGLILNRDEYNLLVELLRDKMEYDINTLFFAIELTNFLGETLRDRTWDGDKTPIVFDISSTDMTYLYTVLSQHKCKGLTKKTYTFSNIIRRIGDISKVINHFDSGSKDLSTEIMDWAACLDDGVTMESLQKSETEEVTGEVIN